MRSIFSTIYVVLGVLSVVLGIVFGMANAVKHDWILLPLSFTFSVVGFRVLMCGLMQQCILPSSVTDKIAEKIKVIFKTA